MCYINCEVIAMADKPYIIDGQRVSRDEYNRMKFDRFLLTVDKGEADKIKKHAEALGMKRNDYIVKLIRADMGE